MFSKTYPISTPVSFGASMLGMRRLAADILWIQILQYYGTHEGAESHSPEIFGAHDHEDELCRHCESDIESGSNTANHGTGYADLKKYWQQIIRIDPLFVNAYLIGPLTLGWNLHRYDEALEIINEGIETVETVIESLADVKVSLPDERNVLLTGSGSLIEELKWELYTLKSVILLLNKENLSGAAEEFGAIAEMPDAPEDLRVILAQIYEKAGLRDKALMQWVYIYDHTQKYSRKLSAAKHMETLAAGISSLNLSPSSSSE